MNKFLILAALYNLGFAVFHLFFWRLFRWKEDLPRLRPVNRAVMQVLNLSLAFLLFALAYVLMFHPAEMLSTSIGRSLLVILSIFWLLRTIEQILFFRINNRISLAFTMVFLAGSLLHLLPLIAAD